MRKDKMQSLLKERNIVIPIYVYKMFPKFNIELDVFMFLMYLYSYGSKIIFNPQKLSEEFGVSMATLLSYIDILSNNKLVSFEIVKNEKNISEEYLSLDYFYDKLSLLLMEEATDEREVDKNIFEMIEKEFGRVLSPIEYEIIKAWSDDDISNELIEEALKEAVFNGVNNLRYIDKILYEWKKKGFKTREDVEKNRKSFNKNKPEKVEVFEYNWLEDDE